MGKKHSKLSKNSNIPEQDIQLATRKCHLTMKTKDTTTKMCRRDQRRKDREQ